jgi:hypothetical protein
MGKTMISLDFHAEKNIIVAENVINEETIPSSKMHSLTSACRKDSFAGTVISFYAWI